jgi:hypothetical protein
MAFLHGKGTSVIANDVNLSSFLNDASVTYSAETAETTAFGSSSKTYIVGLSDGSISLSGMYEGTATTGFDAAIFAALAASNEVTTSIFYGTPAAGVQVSMAGGIITSYDISAPVSDVVSASLEIQADGGVTQGDSLSALAAVSATVTGSEVDRGAGASTTAGTCIAQLHVPVNGRDAGTLTAKLTSSTSSGGSYADVTGGGFTAIAGGSTGSQRLEVSGAINRYVKVVYTVASGSSGSYTPIVTLSKY